MSELYLLRHAKAVAQDEGFADRDRKLIEKGRQAALTIADWIEQHELRPDLVLCSPSARTRETLDLILAAFRRRPELVYEQEIYLADADKLLERLRKLPDSVGRVMIVGHNPGLQELAVSLADTKAGPLAAKLALGLPTATLVRFEVVTEWAALTKRGARLIAVVSPKG
jgi:phosphohistidine phosphatase